MRSAALAATAARLSYAALRQRAPGGDATWSRTNHRGEPVTLLEGPAAAIGGAVGALAATGLPGRSRAALALAAAGAGLLGGYDDLAGNGSSKGFRGHLGALRRGEVTTGAVKIAGIGATGLACSLLAGAGRDGKSSSPVDIAINPARPGTAALMAMSAATDIAINAALIAGGANLLNLFDLRPGRAIKVTLGSGALLSGSERGRAAAAAPLASAVALLNEDLAERAMLGDAGANALGAMLGTAAAVALPGRSARLVTLGVVAGLTAASEKISFTKVIERTRPLRFLDMLGRRPVAPARPAADGTPAWEPPGAPGTRHAGQQDSGQQDSAAGPAGAMPAVPRSR
jgi:hypothetical protein